MQMLEARYSVGDRVLLQLGADAKYAPRGLKRWDGCVFQIEEIRATKSAIKNYSYTYILKCCRSEKGVSYTIAEEWIAKVG